MRINSLQRPDGLFKLHVEQKVGEIQGFPLSTKRERPFTNLVTKEQALQAPPSVGDPTFDPRATFENGGMRIDKITRNYADQVTNPELASLFKVFWSDDRRYVNVQKRYKVGSSNDIDLHQLTFDAEARFLPVDVKHVVRGNIVQEMTWAYESINGIVVPKLFTLRKRGITDGELDVERICTFKESELNAPIDEAEFELASLGVADGDRLLDMTDNTLSIFVDGAPKVITGIEKALPAEGASKIALVLYFNFALLAVVAVVLLVRQLRRAKRAQ